MLPSRGFFRLVVLAGVAVVLGPAQAGHYEGRDVAHAQEPQTPTFRTEANYVRVDVYPTVNGSPVTDLRQEDFEVFEEGAPQRVDAFEHVVIRGNQPASPRVEPNTIAESRSMLENPRARVFVLFLDVHHVNEGADRRIRQPLVNFLNRAIGPDDLVGVMTPDMSGADVTFARKTETIEGLLTRYWWGERDRMNPPDPLMDMYKLCYPGFSSDPGFDDRGIADEMIARYRERETLAALENLVRYLRNLRDERKAVLTITEGWLLYRPNAALARPLGNENGVPRVGIDRNGRLVPSGQRGAVPYDDCERDRQRLAQLDSVQALQDIMDLANRANASFYPVDPRGLAVFDTQPGDPRTGLPPRGQSIMVPPSVDASMLRGRLDSLRNLAFNTDGIPIVNTNDLEGGLRRVTDDLTSYYLLAYYSTGRFDGKFHSITVRVKRPGVQVRARRGYLAPTPEEVAATTARAAPASPAAAAAVAEARAIDTVLMPLNGYARDVPLRLQAVAGWASNGRPAMAIVGEVGASPDWKAGADADLMLLGSTGDTLATARAQVPPGARAFRVALTPAEAVPAGEYSLRVRLRSRLPDVSPVNEALRLILPPAPSANGAAFSRKSAATGNRDMPTADLRFRRTEELAVEWPAASAETATARLLDRTGKALTVPVAVTVRDEPDESRWRVARLALAPLAAGDYVIEVADEGSAARTGQAAVTRTLFAFRVVP